MSQRKTRADKGVPRMAKNADQRQQFIQYYLGLDEAGRASVKSDIELLDVAAAALVQKPRRAAVNGSESNLDLPCDGDSSKSPGDAGRSA